MCKYACFPKNLENQYNIRYSQAATVPKPVLKATPEDSDSEVDASDDDPADESDGWKDVRKIKKAAARAKVKGNAKSKGGKTKAKAKGKGKTKAKRYVCINETIDLPLF